jgi:hypothetical protein
MKKSKVQEVQLLYCGQAYSGDKEHAKHESLISINKDILPNKNA